MLNGNEAFPNFSDSIEKESSIESGQVFMRENISEKFTFMRNDYDYIFNSPFDTEFSFVIEISYDNGNIYDTYFTGIFYKTDCEFNSDDKFVIVNPNPKDRYTNIFQENQFNLVDLAAKIEKVIVRRRPVIQLYDRGMDEITNIIGGHIYTMEIDYIHSDSDLFNIYKFQSYQRFQYSHSDQREMYLTIHIGNLDMGGLYTGYSHSFQPSDDSLDVGTRLYNVNGMYRIDLVSHIGSPLTELSIYDSNNNLIAGKYTFIIDYTQDENTNWAFIWEHQMNNYGLSITFQHATYDFYGRLLLNYDNYEGEIYNTPEANAVPSLKYDYVARYNPFGIIVISGRYSDENIGYGIAPNGKYFMSPDDESTYIPVLQRSWHYGSLWIKYDENLFGLLNEDSLRMPIILNDTYEFHEVVKKILLEIAPEISFDKSPEHSQFLYNSINPITNVEERNLYITPKSNLKKIGYDMAARVGDISFNDLMNMMKNVYKCYWIIDKNNNLVIEHISYFRNGGAYTDENVIGVDITTMINPTMGLTWDYLTNKWTYDKPDIPNEYKFAWMDKTSLFFDGFPIIMNSKYVTKGKTEDITLSKFTTDVDYMITGDSNISDEGFALLTTSFRNIIYDCKSGNGYINNDGTISSSMTSGQIGYGWVYRIFNVMPDTEYGLYDIYGNIMQNVRFTMYDKNMLHIFSSGNTSGVIRTYNNCYFLGLSTANTEDAVPEPDQVNYSTSINKMEERKQSVTLWNVFFKTASFVLNNGQLSWIDLHPRYWRYNLPCRDITMNKRPNTALSIDQKKKQEISFPMIYDLDTNKLVKTGLGNGTIEKINVNLLSRFGKTVLRYDTDE